MISSTSALVALAAVMVPAMAADFQACGGAMFDPAQYICYPGNLLCPIVGGEPLEACGQACFSPYQYECRNGALNALPQATGPVRLTVSNPAVAAIHGVPVAACDSFLWATGATCVVPCPGGVECPPGDTTVLVPDNDADNGGGLAVKVPEGQRYFLDAFGSLGYTQPGGGSPPAGSVSGGTVAYVGGGFVNVNEGALGWRACFPRASGGGDRWSLHAVNATNIDGFSTCSSVNLKVEVLPEGTVGAWQYS